VTHCPTSRELEDFLAGEPRADARGELSAHLQQCDRCRELLDRLSDEPELRQWAREVPSTGETDGPGLARLLEISPKIGAQSTMTDGRGAEPPSLEFLGPPRHEGDLGTLGPYRVLELLGHGGMGIVLRGHDDMLDRVVALKVLRPALAHGRDRVRFVREARAAAQVRHDHVVEVHAVVNPADGLPYIVMEYLAGPTLAQAIGRSGRLGPREAASAAFQVAQGLAAAHAAGLVHRDIKPSNVMLDPAKGRSKITDFGLARQAGESSDVTQEGSAVGTPAYMSPEQARVEAVDARSDIYSLGATLYECLTGEPPFLGKPHRIIHQVINDEPSPPRALIPAIPVDLETICLKAMAKDPSHRYATSAALAADLHRFLNGEPILARPVGPLERAWRWCRNNQRVAALIALVTLLLLTLTVGSILAAVSINRERSVAIASARRADAQRGLAVDALSSLVQGIQDQLATRPGTLELRRSLLEIAREGLSKIPSTDSSGSNPGEIDDRAVEALIRLGDIDITLGRAAEARSEFEQAAKMAERVSKTNPKSALIRGQLASAYERVGDQIKPAYSDKRVPEEAEYHEKALTIRRALVAEHPDDSVYRRDLRGTRYKLAKVRINEENLDEAARLYEESLRELKAEPVDDKNRTAILSDLRSVQSRLADIAAIRGRAAEAIAMYREVLANARALCEIDPQNVSYLRQLGFALDYLGMGCLAFGELDEAERWLTAFRDNRQAAVAADPADQDARRSLALAHQNLGDLAERRRDFDTARAAYRQAVIGMEETARRDPKSVRAYRDHTIALLKILQLEASAGRHAVAAMWAEREVEVLTAKGFPPYPEHAEAVAEATLLRDVYRLIDQCVDNPALARRQEPKVAGRLLCVRALVLARAGRCTEVVAAAQELLKLPSMPSPPFAPPVPFYAAHACAIAAKSAGKSRPEVRAECVKTAVRALRQAPANADVQPLLLPYLPDFEALRDDPDFIALTRPTSPGEPKLEAATTPELKSGNAGRDPP